MKKLTVTFAFTLCLCTFTACETESINDQEYEKDIKSVNAIDKNDDKEEHLPVHL